MDKHRQSTGTVTDSELIEKIVEINRVSKVVKGGRHFGFNALVVVGDGNGKVGFGLGKAREVTDAISKGAELARKSMREFSLAGRTLPHKIIGKYGAGRVMLKPAAPGAGVIAGGPVRAVVESAGLHDILTKCIGTTNKQNVVLATMEALKSLRTAEQIAGERNMDINEIAGDYPVAQQAAQSTEGSSIVGGTKQGVEL